MAKLRKGTTYSKTIERPYTRKSKYKKKNFIKANPANKVIMYDMGDPKKKFEYTLDLISKDQVQLRHNSIESARMSSNRLLENTLGKVGYHFKIRIYPHHILRENPLATGAGADRFSTGMQKSFGKPIGLAARIKKGQKLFTVSVNKNGLNTAKAALIRAKNKMPCSCIIEQNRNN